MTGALHVELQQYIEAIGKVFVCLEMDHFNCVITCVNTVLKVLKEIEVKSYEELVPNDMSPGIIGPNDERCLGIVYGKKCLPDQDRWLGTYSKISKYFMRSVAVLISG